MRTLSYIFVFSLFSAFSTAQTGPGGVGNNSNNGIWLRASDFNGVDGTAVSSWSDFSGNGNNAAQSDPTKQPLFYNSSSLNGQPIIRLDGNNDELAILDNAILDGSAGITYYTVLRPNNLNGAARGILGKRVTFTVSTQYAYTWFFYGGNQLNCDIHTQNNRFTSGSNTFSNATNYVFSLDFDGSLPSAQRSRMFSNGFKIAQATESSTVLPNSNQDVAIGALNVSYGTYLGADYGEIIHYNYSLDSSEHIIVSNYLAAKYGISLSVNDLYNEDHPANGDYDFQVAGIGRINAAILHNDSKGDGLVRINNPTDLGDNEFMFWGHDGQAALAYEYADIPLSLQARFSRVWRVSEVNTSGTAIDVGAVDMIWDLSSSGPVTVSDLRLLIDTDNDGLFSDETPISGALDLGGGQYQFSGVTGLADNLRFTLGTINSTQTPLPISLLYFNAMANSQFHVDLNWETASEMNNDYFTLEKSTDGNLWESFATIDGAGNSSNSIHYQFVDQDPFFGISYYRLRQTDFDGTSTLSEIQSVEIKRLGMATKIYPNPTISKLFIEGNEEEMQDIRVFNSLGQNLSQQVIYRKLSDISYELDLNALAPGVYFLRLKSEGYTIQKQ